MTNETTINSPDTRKEKLVEILAELTKEEKLATYPAIANKMGVSRQRATHLFSSYKNLIDKQSKDLKASLLKRSISKAFPSGVPNGISIHAFIEAIDLPFVNSGNPDYIRSFMKPYGVEFTDRKGGVKRIDTIVFIDFLKSQSTSELTVDEIVKLASKQVKLPKSFKCNAHSFLSKNGIPFKIKRQALKWYKD